jgi:hypothetical protein
MEARSFLLLHGRGVPHDLVLFERAGSTPGLQTWR